ncbi:MAG TPA: NUDIX domain-containing protein [Chthoniobacterales bacterium]|nr:NUDIX domain-containing protein [Chthoniobacterales bacterium]
MQRAKTSAGLLAFRRSSGQLEVLLVHPGGPFFRNKDAGAWSIPKGEVSADEDLKARAATEFEEELGISAPPAPWIDLGAAKQKGGKTVHGWAVEMELPKDFACVSNTFELEWPPRSGRTQEFPEVDQAEFFLIEAAALKINPAQVVFLERLVEALGKGVST